MAGVTEGQDDEKQWEGKVGGQVWNTRPGD